VPSASKTDLNLWHCSVYSRPLAQFFPIWTSPLVNNLYISVCPFTVKQRNKQKRKSKCTSEAEILKETLIELQEKESQRVDDNLRQQQEREEKQRKFKDEREEK
jgi:hypothetical protein